VRIVDVPVCVNDVVQGVGAVDHGPDITVRHQLDERHQVFATEFRCPVVDRDAGAAADIGVGCACRVRRPKIGVGSFVATSRQKPWPSAGSFVAGYRQFFMASDKRIGHPSRDTRGATNRSPLA